MNFNYLGSTTFQDSIDIEDIGNVCLDAFNDFGEEWLLKINTSLGWVKVEQFGPLLNDCLESRLNFLRYEMEFKETKLYNTIDKFLNDNKNITQVFVIDEEEYKSKLQLLKTILE